MLRDYFKAAMRTARYQIMEDGRYWGEIPSMQGVWADADTLEECRDRLFEVMEEWTLMGYWTHATLPIIDGMDPNLKMEAEVDAHEAARTDSEVA